MHIGVSLLEKSRKSSRQHGGDQYARARDGNSRPISRCFSNAGAVRETVWRVHSHQTLSHVSAALASLGVLLRLPW